jgi:hypothetical protein
MTFDAFGLSSRLSKILTPNIRREAKISGKRANFRAELESLFTAAGWEGDGLPYLSHSRNAFASSQLTFTTGW